MLKPSNPSTRFRFTRWAMSDHKSVADVLSFKIEVPPEILLAGLLIGPYALLAKLADEPLGHIVSETAGIEEIVAWVRHVEGRAFKSDDRPDL